MTPEEQAAADASALAQTNADAKAAADAKGKDDKGKEESFSREYVERLRAEAKTAKDSAKALSDEKASRETDEAKAKDDQKKLAELADKRAKSAEDKLEAAIAGTNKRLMATELRSLAREAGILDVDDIKLLDLKDVSVDDDGEVLGAKAVIEAFKKLKPHKFKADGDDSSKKETEGTKRTPNTNTSAKGKEIDYQSKDVTDSEFEKAWSTAGRA